MSYLEDRRMAIALQRTIDSIAEHGWMITGVFPGDPERGEPLTATFAYTAGLTDRGLPELVITGLPPNQAGPLLNDIARALIAAREQGRSIQAGEQVSGLVKGYALLFRDVNPDDEDYPMSVARQVYPTCTAMQVIWPDKAGAFPGDPGCTLSPATQPLLPGAVPE